MIPWDTDRLLKEGDERLEFYPGLARWCARTEKEWEGHRKSEQLTLGANLDYHGKLSKQFPVRPHRIVYAKSGMHLCAARLEGGRGLIDHTLYWATANSEPEAHYLCAVLNSAALIEKVRPFMSYGKDERHIDKHVWKVPIPLFDAADGLHAAIAGLGAQIEAEVAVLDIDDNLHFPTARRRIRRYIETSATGRQNEALVLELLDTA